ncbi:MAG: hypothetical protein HN348_03345, partial [Proteobacteria bacterium]|nr:hypothetical protein [Pseudomonadota bacterium]
DRDGDGHSSLEGDCDDANSTVYPSAPERCDGVLNDCLETALSSEEVDNDGDGYVECAIDASGWFGTPIVGGRDCDDTEDTLGVNTYPGSAPLDDESKCLADGDGDDFGDDNPKRSGVAVGTDCDDEYFKVNPHSLEVLDGLDNDCEGSVDRISLGNVDAKITGEGAEDRAGGAVAGVGDFDGDGFADVVVSARNHNGSMGAVYLLYGSPSAISSMSLSVTTKLLGHEEGAAAGRSIAPAGDVDQDGYDDFLVAAEDRSYLVTGTSNQVPSSFLHDAGVRLPGNRVVAGAGDFNGDTYNDILVGGDYGDLHLILGAAHLEDSPQVVLDTPCGTPSVSSAGDFNGDGNDDVVVGQEDQECAGVFLLPGTDEPIDVMLMDDGVKFDGEDKYDYAGKSVSGVGDFDGDGYGDFMVGAPLHDNRSGAAYVVMGSTNPVGMSLADVSTKFLGEGWEHQAGWSVAGAGDVDGDLYPDLLVGAANFSDSSFHDCGAAYLIFGPVVGVFSLSMADARFSGESHVNFAGASVSGVGDVNRDGFDDLLIGAEGEASVADYAGAAYLVLGSHF